MNMINKHYSMIKNITTLLKNILMVLILLYLIKRESKIKKIKKHYNHKFL